MSESITDILLTQVINHGAPLFGLYLMLGALGVPVGASFILIAVGAFSQQGYFSWPEMAVYGLVGALIGDALSFGIGRFGKKGVLRRLGESPAWKNATDYFQRKAWVAIFFTRFLITALAIPTNLIAGGSGYRFSRFMWYDALGETIWVLLYGALGYLFGSQWETVSQIVSDFGAMLLGIVLIFAGIRLGMRWLGSHPLDTQKFLKNYQPRR
jgi:membrane protein DedA with SNARE-associated domain